MYFRQQNVAATFFFFFHIQDGGRLPVKVTDFFFYV